MELEKELWNKLIEFKDQCWVNGRLSSYRLSEYTRKIWQFKEAGYDVKIHELILERLRYVAGKK